MYIRFTGLLDLDNLEINLKELLKYKNYWDTILLCVKKESRKSTGFAFYVWPVAHEWFYNNCGVILHFKISVISVNYVAISQLIMILE